MDVVCASCGDTFQAEEEPAARSEACPYCGALNDIPAIAPLELEFRPNISPEELLKEDSRGIPSALWWPAALLAIGASLVVAYNMLHSDDWERRHLQDLTDADKRADAYFTTGDFKEAAQQYQIILETLDHRSIQSLFLRDLLSHAEQGAAESQTRLRTVAARPTTIAAAPTTVPDETQGIPHDAMLQFQRRVESFAQFVHDHPVTFRDASGNWRRRRFIVWEVDAQVQPDAQPPQIMLKYTCNSLKTAAHDDPSDAKNDSDFIYEDHVQPIHCQTIFEYQSGKWLAGERQNDLESRENPTISGGKLSLDFSIDLADLHALEDRVFAITLH